jgi:beta-phosphoglucomutase-like phosphatase (HAD superfamily)
MKIGAAFPVVVSADHPRVSAPKPAPDVYLIACEELGVAPAQAVAIEDSPIGAEAALAAGLTTYAVPNDWTNGREFPEAAIRADGLLEVATQLGL